MKPITVKELIKQLKTLNQNAIVAISVDSEGNSFSPIPNEMFYCNAYMKNELGSQDNYFEQEEMEKEGDTVSDFYGNKTPKKELVETVILWPSN